MPYSVAEIATMVFFVCVFISRFFSASATVTAVGAVAAIIAAIAILVRK